MAPESPGNLVAIDLEWKNSKLECLVERFDPTGDGHAFLHVSWNAIECPERYVPLRSGAAYVWVPPTFEHRRYRARVDETNEGGFEWLDRGFGVGMMLILKLPRGCTYKFPSESKRSPIPIRFKSTDDGRMAFYSWLAGSGDDGRVVFSWQMECNENVEVEAQCKLLNQEARRIQPAPSEVHTDLPVGQSAVPSAQLPTHSEPPPWHINKLVVGVLMDASTHVTNTITDSPGAIANVAKDIAHVTNTVTQQLNASAAPEEVKTLVRQLAEEIAAISQLANPTEIKEMSNDLTTLSNEMAGPKPRREWYALSLKGIKEAALTVGEIAKPILDIVAKLGPLLIS
jgi:hypothetical protein